MGSVVVLKSGKTGDQQKKSDEQWRRRQALQLVAQLPEEEEEALAVLECAQQIVKMIGSGAKLA